MMFKLALMLVPVACNVMHLPLRGGPQCVCEPAPQPERVHGWQTKAASVLVSCEWFEH